MKSLEKRVARDMGLEKESEAIASNFWSFEVRG